MFKAGWCFFATGVLVATNVYDGSIRLWESGRSVNE